MMRNLWALFPIIVFYFAVIAGAGLFIISILISLCS